MTKKIDLSRRNFLRNASLISAAGSVAAPFALNLFAMNVAAAAAQTADYKALVCVFLAGGNDHNNTVIATDPNSWAGYLAARNTGGSASIALMNSDTTSNVLNLTPNDPQNRNPGRSFALHPNMPGMKSLFDSGRAAVIANVGPLIKPIKTKTQYQSLSAADKPANLFSHSDQTSQWNSTNPAKQIYGWGGRMADQLIGSNTAQNLSCMSLSGNSVFLAGETINQYQINSNGTPTAIGGFSNLFGSTGNYLQPIITTPSSSNMFELEHAAVVSRAIAAQANLNSIMTAFPASGIAPSASIQYTIPNTNPPALADNSLAIQLRTVARIIAGRNIAGVGAHRQVFFVTLGGFDTHDFQAVNHASLMARLSHAVDYFNTALVTLPGGDMSSNVTLFTASDFGRTLTSNGDGTDHGWGAHHFVVGGAVNGNQIYGTFPKTVVNSVSTNNLDVGSGNYIPQISVDQYAGTLARWFGLSPSEIATVFPNLNNFSLANDPAIPVDPATIGGLGTDLGFV